MRFNVAHLLKGAVGTKKSYSVDESFAPLEDTQTDHVQGRLSFIRTHARVWVSGALNASAVATCSRCLKEFAFAMRFQIDDVYYPTVDVNTGVALALPEDAESQCTIDAHHILDITEAVRQYTVVVLPMKPLCRPDCAGLCPQCGIDLNQATCSCNAYRVDPRWLPLLDLASSSQGRTSRS